GNSVAPSGRQPRHHLLRRRGRHLVADQPIEDAAALLRFDQLHVEVTPVLDRLVDGVAGDLVEDHPPHRHVRAQHLEHVPRDRLTLAVLVSREVELAGVGQRVLELLDDVLLLLRDDVDRLKVVPDVDAEPSGVRSLEPLRHFARVARQVADVTDTRLHDVVRAEIPRDRAGLRGRFDDYERLGHVRNPLRGGSRTGQPGEVGLTVVPRTGYPCQTFPDRPPRPLARVPSCLSCRAMLVAALSLDPKDLLESFGPWATIALFLIIFAETGLLIGFFLPGDSLLFTAGILASQGNLNIAVIAIGCFLAAVIGGQVGYTIGRRAGPALFRRPHSRVFKQE